MVLIKKIGKIMVPNFVPNSMTFNIIFWHSIIHYVSEKAMAPHSSTLAWKVPWTEEPGGLQSMRSLTVRHNWTTSLSLFTFHFHALEKEMATHSSILALRIPGMGEPGGLQSLGSHRVGHDWSDLAECSISKDVDLNVYLLWNSITLSQKANFCIHAHFLLW